MGCRLARVWLRPRNGSSLSLTGSRRDLRSVRLPPGRSARRHCRFLAQGVLRSLNDAFAEYLPFQHWRPIIGEHAGNGTRGCPTIVKRRSAPSRLHHELIDEFGQDHDGPVHDGRFENRIQSNRCSDNLRPEQSKGLPVMRGARVIAPAPHPAGKPGR